MHRAKVDGCISLAAATRQDPLEWFIGFGSISGRFGANGHTDYSLANDMLAKCIGRLSTDRPDVRCVTFHWHAWGDIGMAAKPETKLALEMIGMRFMPSAEGLKHFLDEITYGGDSSEVLITDTAHVRKFMPEIPPHDSGRPVYPMLDPRDRRNLKAQADCHVVTLDAASPFMREHRVGDRPTLPFVIALQMMAEAASLQMNHQPIISCLEVRTFHPIKLGDESAMAIEIVKEPSPALESTWAIRGDLRRADGRLVEEGRKHFQASFQTESSDWNSRRRIRKISLPLERSWKFEPIHYVPAGAPVYHGDSFQMLREIAIEGNEALARITAPSPIQVAGPSYPLAGWIIPCAAMDAVLYAAALMAYRSTGKLGLPISFGQIHLGRFPEPGEPLTSHIRGTKADDRGMTFTAQLVGQNGDCILDIDNYQVRWLVGNALPDRKNSSATQVIG